MNTIESLKRNMIYISLLSSLTLSTMKTHANETGSNSSTTDSIASMERVLNINGSFGSILHPEKINLSHEKLTLSPDSQFTGSIIANSSDIHINQANVHGHVYLHQQWPGDEFTTHELNLFNTTLSSTYPGAALETEDSDVNIQHSWISNSDGGGISISKKYADMNEDFLPDATIEKSTITTGNNYGILNRQSNVNIDNTVIKTGKQNKNNSQSLGISIVADNSDDDKNTITNISNSKINSYGDGLLMFGGDTRIVNSIITARNDYAVMTEGGDLTLSQGTELKASDTACGIYTVAGNPGVYNINKITIDNSTISTANNAAIIVNRRELNDNVANKTDITLRNNSQVSAGNGVALISWSDSEVSLGIHSSHVHGEIRAHQESIVNVFLGQHSLFDGYTKNVNDFFSVDKSLWKITSSSDIDNLYHAGDIELTNERKKSIELLINNNYIGKNGTMTFNSKTTDDRVFPGKLMIHGDSIGNTNIVINNIGGMSDARLNRFELIHVDGASKAVFNQSGRIVAGAYDYSLVRGQGRDTGNWYLTSQTSLNNPEARYTVRPEAASYIANLSAANSLFTTAMNDRPTEIHYTDRFTGEKKPTRLWLRQAGSHNGWRDNSGQLTSQTNSIMTQLGGDILRWTTNNRNQGHIGLMTGLGNSRSTSHSSVTNYHSKGSVKGYSIGTYASWHANHTNKSGLYINSWLQYNWFNNRVQGQGISAENYQSKGINTSFEAGYTLNMGKLTSNKETMNSWFLQPQAQITWMNVKASNHREANGTHVISKSEGNIQARLGIRASVKGHHIMDTNKGREFEPFIEANWLHNTRDFSVRMDDVRISQAGTRNIGEVKIGIAGKINPKVNLWGNIGTQVGHKGYNNTHAAVGIKYNF